MKRAITGFIYNCVACRELRGSVEQQQMSNLLSERFRQKPPFTNVGLDVFGPWEVSTRGTRGGRANSKRWAILFTCMSTRAVYMELIEAMSASSCVNALHRFFAIRGPAKQLESAHGTNFIGASKDLKVTSEGDATVENYLLTQGYTLVLNPHHASNMGGNWERMVGTTRRILSTLMAEVTAIINFRQ